MNPNKSGWIPKYFDILQYQEQKDKALKVQEGRHALSPDQQFYQKLQPSGLVYGFPTNLLYLDNKYLQEWSEHEALKVLLLEGFLSTEVIKGQRPELSPGLASDIALFYEKSRLVTNPKIKLNLFGTKDPAQKLEKIFAQRVDIKIRFDSKLWVSYMYNSLLFNDLISFFEIQTGISDDFLMEKREKVIEALLKTMSAAAHSDARIAEQEKTMFEVFLASASISNQKKKALRQFFKAGKGLEDIDLSVVDSWILKRYFIELALLTIWTDQESTPEEEAFLETLMKKLGLSEEEVEESFMAIDAFVCENFERLPYFKTKSDYQRIYGNLSGNFRRVLLRNQKKLALELKESKELVRLISISTRRELTPEEKVALNSQMKDLALAIPALTVFMLPGGSVLLPILIKIIPNILPSAFRDNQLGPNRE